MKLIFTTNYPIGLTSIFRKITTAVCCLFAVYASAQVTPTAGEIECFLTGDGAVFTDHGGLGGDNAIEGAPGNYTNCDCVTTTTICSPDASALTAEITGFGVFATFDWLVILDTDNPASLQFPSNIIDDPSNATLQLFNNSSGAGNGGAENYGDGAQNGQSTLPELTVTEFTSTNPAGCLTFVFRASGVVDDSGWDIDVSTASGIGHPGDNIPCGTNLDCFPPGGIEITDITGNSAVVSWNASADATNGYIVEYGPAGFVPGTGTVVTTDDLSILIDGLDQITDYAVYVQSDCGVDGTSFNVGPNAFTTDFSCPLASDLVFSDVSPTSFVASWTAPINAVSFNVEYGPTGFTPGSGTTVMVTDPTILIDGLEENTLYDIYVEVNCGNDGSSPTTTTATVQTQFFNPPATCNYFIELNDTGTGTTGWDGAFVSVTTNNITYTFTLNGIDDDGVNAVLPISVLDGFDLTVQYTGGTGSNFSNSFIISDADEITLYESGTNPAQNTDLFTTTAFCPNCPAATPVNNFFAANVTDTTASLLWTGVPEAMFYILEYGPTGFPLGVGVLDTAMFNSFVLDGLNPCVTYDVYLTVFCGVDSLSTTIGPLVITTDYTFEGTPGDTCNYQVDLFDSFGDGWGGGILEIEQDGSTQDFTLNGIDDDGEQASFDVPLVGNLTATVSYVATFSSGEVSYDLIDPDGNIIFSDGPAPELGEVFDFIACPDCPPIFNAELTDVNANNASISWIGASGATGSYIIEYGTLGFTLGTGSTISAGISDDEATMTGLEENTWYDVYITLDCGNELSKSFGPISFQTLFLNDVGIGAIANPVADSCNLSSEEIVTIGIQNFGQNPQSLFEYYFAVNGVPANVTPPTDGLFTGVVGNDSIIFVDFDLTFDFSEPGYYLIEAWTEMDNDGNPANDTFRTEVVTAFPLPLREDFEDGEFPEGWFTDEFNPIYAPGAHNAPTFLIGDNVWSADPVFEVITPRFGPLGDSDSLTFDYRYVEFSLGTDSTILGDDRLEVFVSTDCGETYDLVFTVDSNNHVPTTAMTNRSVDLSAYAGQGITVRFLGTWQTGDYFLDLDNINISGCPTTIPVTSSVVQPTVDIGDNGSITITPLIDGNGPYTYEWNIGETTPTISDLLSGEYIVTITDNNGCEDVRGFTLEEVVNTDEVTADVEVTIAPNPTNGLATISVNLDRQTDVSMQIFSMDGRLVAGSEHQNVRSYTEEVNLSNEPSGMYFVRMVMEGKAHYEKIILTK